MRDKPRCDSTLKTKRKAPNALRANLTILIPTFFTIALHRKNVISSSCYTVCRRNVLREFFPSCIDTYPFTYPSK